MSREKGPETDPLKELGKRFAEAFPVVTGVSGETGADYSENYSSASVQREAHEQLVADDSARIAGQRPSTPDLDPTERVEVPAVYRSTVPPKHDPDAETLPSPQAPNATRVPRFLDQLSEARKAHEAHVDVATLDPACPFCTGDLT